MDVCPQEPDGSLQNISCTPVISVVDDDVSIRESLQGLLKSAGWQAEIFASGAAFLHSEALHRTKCLVLDVDMPEMTGPELQSELASRAHRIPIIFITAHGDGDRDSELRLRVLAEGAAAFLRKPFDEDALLNEIESAVRGASPLPCLRTGQSSLAALGKTLTINKLRELP